MRKSNGRPRILIESSAWIASFHRRGPESIRLAVDECLAREVAATTGMIVVEVLQGSPSAKAFSRVEKLLGLLERLPVDEFTWHETARLANELRRRGLTVPAVDLLTAAVAIMNGCTLLHCDKHFEMIAEHAPLKAWNPAN